MAPAKATTTDAVSFTAPAELIDDTMLVRLPPEASTQLPSRGQVAVRATIAGRKVDTVVEPDGRRGHWLRIAAPLRRSARIAAGDPVACTLAVAAEWPEPEVPDDLAAALAQAPAPVQQLWEEITPMARWEWVRWVQATRNPATRDKRVTVSISKMDHGKRRPCCFDLSSCTDPELARSGKLREPS